MVNLISKDWFENHQTDLPEWQQDAFRKFGQMINDPDQMYPCIPGRLGFISNSLRFGFAADPRSEEAINNVAKLLQQYGECSRETGKYASLVVFFNTPNELADGFSIEDYEQLFWSVLSRGSAKDQAPWPSHISSDPTHHTWEFCYNGHPYFAFWGPPATEIRKSRRTPCFLITFQPRWVFEEINDSTSFGRNMKKLIHQKLVEYDGVPALQ
ncbi:YqcI/YcgG family protein [Paenibacillus andongensis]|uniref:YqcI/YcgG family protein n=1 Tax=Paenibacillus andongensis TaxID=2975482 RepID=UPI0021BB4DFE|nr:YqcI/YcgG family protein [Paenibacillus andongensis]